MRIAIVKPDTAKIEEPLCLTVYTENPKILIDAESPARRADVRCIHEGNG
ncbi:MAG: hypothetical protein IVZ94_00715 [Nitrospirae bacterium]|nr:hypothetical protein [Nitrospirota bacterium]